MYLYTLITVTLVVVAIVYARRYSHAHLRNTELASQRDQIAFIIENLDEGLIEYDNDYKIIRLNHAAEVMFDLSAVDIVGRPITTDIDVGNPLRPLADIIHPRIGDNARVLKAEGSAKDGGAATVKIEEIDLIYPKEKTVKTFTIPKLVGKERTVSGFIKIIRDVTKEEFISRSKTDMIAVVIHQLRSPLAGIKWIFSSLIAGEVGKLLPEQQSILEKGHSAVNTLSQLIDDLLDMSRIEEGTIEYTFSEADLIPFLRDIIQSEATGAKEKNIKITDTFPTTPVRIAFDAKRLRIVIANLIENAISYSRNDTSIEIGLTTTTDGGAEIAIVDHGIGIPPTSEKKIFEKFYRADNARKIKTRGTGLGLFIAKSVVLSHRGAIWFESQEGQGTTFHIRLPKSPKDVPASKAPQTASERKHVYGL